MEERIAADRCRRNADGEVQVSPSALGCDETPETGARLVRPPKEAIATAANSLHGHAIADASYLSAYLPALHKWRDFVEESRAMVLAAQQNDALASYLAHPCYNGCRVSSGQEHHCGTSALWTADASVQRYAKTHAYIAARARLPDDILKIAKQYMMLVDERFAKPLE